MDFTTLLNWLMTPQGAGVSGTLPPVALDPNLNPRAAALGVSGPLSSGIPASIAAPPMKPAAPVALPAQAPGLLSAPAPAPVPPPSKPAGLLSAPQPTSPMASGAGMPQPVSPLVSGGPMPDLPGDMAQAGGSFWDKINKPEFWRGLGDFGAQMLAASGPSTNPASGSFGGALGMGLQGFQQGQEAYRQEQRQIESDKINNLYKMQIAAGQGGGSGKAPQVETFYDPQTGREYKAQWNGQGWEPIGGTKAAARIGGAGGGGPGGVNNTLIDNERALRSDYQRQIKEIVPIYDGWQRVQSGAKLGSGVGDMSIIFGYMKMLDPGSVVREGEYANARNAAGVPEQIMAEYNRIVGGGILSESQRQQFLQGAEAAWKPYEARMNDAKRVYGDLAKSYGMDPNRITIDVVPPGGGGGQTTGGPQPGDVIDGYRFLGGDPNDPASWEAE